MEIRAQAERDSGIGLKLFGFIAESVFTFIPESCSRSPRNSVRNHPGIAFTFPRIPHSIEVLIPAWFGERVLPVTQAITERWGSLDAQRQQIGRPLGVVDGMIAATALKRGLTVVTRNFKDFAGLGVAIFNPWDAA
jgi:hypothetical protein